RARMREGREAEAVAMLERLANDKAVARHVRDRAVEDLADLTLLDGKGAAAAAIYREIQAHTNDEDALRTLAVKIAAAGDARLRPAVTALLIGSRTRGPDRALSLELLREVGVTAPEGEGDGLVWYLMGRQYANGPYEEAAARLDRALALPIRLPRVRIE